MYTSSGVCGASTEPTRPSSEAAVSARARTPVGNSSVVNTYSELNAAVAASLPAKYSPSPAPECAATHSHCLQLYVLDYIALYTRRKPYYLQQKKLNFLEITYN